MKELIIRKIGKWWLKRQLSSKDSNIKYLEDQIKLTEVSLQEKIKELEERKDLYREMQRILDKFNQL